MWLRKVFKTKSDYERWMARHGHRVQYVHTFVNNAYLGIEYRFLRRIG